LKILALLIVALCGGVLLYATMDFPAWGDPASPASIHVSPRYLEKALTETAVPNVVTAVLADYRGYDTMFETSVIFCAGVACFVLLRVFGKSRQDRYYRHVPTGIVIHIQDRSQIEEKPDEFERIDAEWTPYDLIIKTLCRFLVPFIQLFALYVIAHGHHSPGGGFQGGVILGASIILLAISFNLRSAVTRVPEKVNALLSAAGVLIYAGTGAVCVAFGANFLDYAGLSGILPGGAVEARSYGIFAVEIGVGIAVMGVMIAIYSLLASEGRLEEGL
jgi:multicomponent Na+:H+ antiporter subunit B